MSTKIEQEVNESLHEQRLAHLQEQVVAVEAQLYKTRFAVLVRTTVVLAVFIFAMAAVAGVAYRIFNFVSGDTYGCETQTIQKSFKRTT